MCPICFEPHPSHKVRFNHRFVYINDFHWSLSIHYKNTTIEISRECPSNGFNYNYYVYLQIGSNEYQLPEFELCNTLEVLNKFMKIKSFA